MPSQIIRFWGFRNVGCFCCSDARVWCRFVSRRKTLQIFQPPADHNGGALTWTFHTQHVSATEIGGTLASNSQVVLLICEEATSRKQLRKG